MKNNGTVISLAERMGFSDKDNAHRGPRVMGSNVARDILKRASDFPGFSSSIFEYIANGHESYQIGDLDREIHIDIKKGAGGRIMIRDTGCGMSYEQLSSFWKMHGETKRRVDGLNLRGYNGTGKIAGFKYFNMLKLETIKDGLRNVTQLNRKHIEEMSKAELPVQIEEVAIDEPTDFANGTMVILSHSIEPITSAHIIELREKIAMEMMMWMKGTKIFVNGELIEAEEVTFDEDHKVLSDCGSFHIHLMYLDRGYKDELQSIFINADRVFLARENYGKEGHRFSSNVHAVVTTTPEWYSEHFEGRREMFVSEARDLKLKLTHPEAQRLKAFIETNVRSYMKKLDEDEKARQQKQLDERKRELMNKFNRVFSNMFDRLEFKRRSEKSTPSEEPQKRNRSENPRERKPKINFMLKEFENDSSDYRIDQVQGIIEVNMKSPQLANVVESKHDATWDQAVLEILKSAFVEMVATRRLNETFAERTMDVPEFIRESSELSRVLRIDVNTMLREMYRGFQALRLSTIAE